MSKKPHCWISVRRRSLRARGRRLGPAGRHRRLRLEQVERRELLSAATLVEVGPVVLDAHLGLETGRWIAELAIGTPGSEWRIESAHRITPTHRPNLDLARGDLREWAVQPPSDRPAADPTDEAAGSIDDSRDLPSGDAKREGGLIDIGGLGVMVHALSIAEASASTGEFSTATQGGASSIESVGGTPLMLRAEEAVGATDVGAAQDGAISYDAAAPEPIARDAIPPEPLVDEAVSAASVAQETAAPATQESIPPEPATRDAPATGAATGSRDEPPLLAAPADNGVAAAGTSQRGEQPVDPGDDAAESTVAEQDVESKSEPQDDSEETRLRAISPAELAREESEGGWIDLTCVVNDPVRFDPETDVPEDASQALADVRQPDQVPAEAPAVAGSRGRSQVFELATAAGREPAAVADLPRIDPAPPIEVIRANIPFGASSDAASAVRAPLDEAALIPSGARDVIFAEMAKEPQDLAKPSPNEQTRWSASAIVFLAPAVVVFDVAGRIARRQDRRCPLTLADWRFS